MNIGYARVSTQDQDLTLQLDDLKKYGCHKIFTDKISGAKNDRPGLGECLSVLQSGDVLVVWRLDRLGRSMQHLVNLITELRGRGISFLSLKDGAIDTTTASGELVFNIFAALAQFERELIRERTLAGLAVARAKGKIGGRKRVEVDDTRVSSIVSAYSSGMKPKEICRVFKVSRATVYRYLSL